MSKSLGIFGGTFDPIHYGHLLAAEWAREFWDLEEIIFIPSARPPHKDLGGVSDSRHRYRMVELAIEGNPGFSASAIELERAGYSYTVDTIAHYNQVKPGADIYFIIGVDALQLMYTWKSPEQLLKLCRLIAVTRPGYQLDQSDACFQSAPSALWERLTLLPIPGLEISSSDIRQRVMEGKSIRYLVPPAIEEYIRQNELYK